MPGHMARATTAFWTVQGLMALLYALVVVPTWGWTYWDFGDGNYLYIAGRVREGAVLYRDILAPQPPLHIVMGVLFQGIGSLFGEPLYGVRFYCMLCRIAAAVVLGLIAREAFGCAMRGVVASALLYLMPIGFWWSLCYQSENIELPLLLAAMLLLLRWETRGALWAGVASGLALHTNMTALCYFGVNAIFLLCRKPRLAVPYAGAALGVWGAGAVAAQLASGGYYLDNTILNQVGTFPRTEMLAEARAATGSGPATLIEYAMGKIASQGASVLRLEGYLILAALASLALHAAEGPLWRDIAADDESARATRLRREFLCWSAIGMFLSICFTAKGGTMDYIFVLGEPAVALFAADASVRLFRASLPARADAAPWFSFGNTQTFLRALFPAGALALALHVPLGHIRLTLHEHQAELPEAEALALRGFIQTYAKPGELILAPPFYAFLSGTHVAGEIAENYIWQIKYHNERFDMRTRGANAGLGVRKMEEVAALLARGEAKAVLLDMNQTGRIPEIAAAIQQAYIEAEPGPVRTRNVELRLFVPRGTPLRHAPLMPRP
jgi:hypothetical protein